MSQTTEFKIGQAGSPEPNQVHLSSEPPFGPRKSGRPRKHAVLLAVVLVVLAGLAIGGYKWTRRGLITVQTGKVVRQDLTAIVTASGEIKPPPDKFATVNANSFGRVTEILVKEGDHVKKGQLLLRTEDVQQDADVRAQQAALTSARANAEVSQASVDSAAANLQTAQANLSQAEAKYKQAKDDFARSQALFKEELIARQVFDQDLSNYKVAEATMDSSKAQVAQAKAQLSQAQYNHAMARASVLQSQAQLIGVKDAWNKTIYTAPLDGVITSLPVHTGENVVPGIQNQVGSVLFQISNLSVVTAEVDVDESDIVSVKDGQPADVTIDAVPDKTFKGHVTQIGMSAISPTSGQTTTTNNQDTSSTGEAKDFKVVVTLDNPPPGMRPGLSTTAKITTATRHDVVTVPIQAITIREQRELEKEKNKNSSGKALAADASTAAPPASDKQELQGVFLVRNGRATFMPVKTGIMGVTSVEVLSGLDPGQEIVTGSYQVLRMLTDSAKIKVDNRVSAGGPPPSS